MASFLARQLSAGPSPRCHTQAPNHSRSHLLSGLRRGRGYAALLPSTFADSSHREFYRPSRVECRSSKPGKAVGKSAPAAGKQRVRSMVAEVETLLERLERGEEAQLPQPSLAASLQRAPSSSSSSSGHSSESDSSDSEDEREQRRRRRRRQPAAAALTAADFERQREELLARVASGTLTGPAPAANNVLPRGGVGSGRGAAPAAAPAATRVSVCLGKACSRRGAAQVLAAAQAAAAAPGAAGAHLEVSGCAKCFGKCKAAVNVRVTPPGGSTVMHGMVTPSSVRAVLQGSLAGQDLFDFV